MRNKVIWGINITLIIVLVGVLWMFVLNDDDGDDGATAAPPSSTTTTTEPDREWVPDGPHAADIRRAARGLDLSAYEDILEGDLDDWEIGVVRKPTGVALAVRTSTGVRLLTEGGCSGSRDLPESYFDSLFSEGDLVLFSNYSGDAGHVDDHVCSGEIVLMQEAEEREEQE